MLSDRERKMLRILYNLTHMHRERPWMQKLERLSGYNRRDIVAAIEGLERERYIHWPERNVSDITVLEGWERETAPPDRTPTKPNNLGAWFL